MPSFQAGTAALIQSMFKRRTPAETVRILKAYWPPEASAGNWHLEAAWGRLHHWSREAVREAVESLSEHFWEDGSREKSFLEMLKDALGAG